MVFAIAGDELVTLSVRSWPRDDLAREVERILDSEFPPDSIRDARWAGTQPASAPTAANARRRADEGDRIAGLQPVDQRGDEFRGPPAETGAHQYSDRHKRHDPLEHESDDISLIGAKRHPDADFDASSCHGIRRHAVESNARKQERQKAEEPGEDGHEALLHEGRRT